MTATLRRRLNDYETRLDDLRARAARVGDALDVFLARSFDVRTLADPSAEARKVAVIHLRGLFRLNRYVDRWRAAIADAFLDVYVSRHRTLLEASPWYRREVEAAYERSERLTHALLIAYGSTDPSRWHLTRCETCVGDLTEIHVELEPTSHPIPEPELRAAVYTASSLCDDWDRADAYGLSAEDVARLREHGENVRRDLEEN